MRFQYDKGGKWLIERFAGSILKLAGVGPIRAWKPLPGEVVQSRQLPDGMVEAELEGRDEPVLFLIEINTYPYPRVPEELFDDIALTYLNRRVVPEAISLTLCERGPQSTPKSLSFASPLGFAGMTANWRVVNLWELNADDFLPIREAGLAPWIPLMRIDGPPEPVLKQCQEAIVSRTEGGEQENLRLITEILAGLRHDATLLKFLFRRGDRMIESPVLDELFAEREVASLHALVIKKLERRFGAVPSDVAASVRVVRDRSRLEFLLDQAYASPSLAAFRTSIATI